MKPALAQKIGIREQIDVCLGQVAIPIGQLTYVRQGQRENTTFAYSEQWLNDPQRFEISPDLELVPGYQSRRAPSKHDSVFHFALADTEPDAWGRRVIAREHAKRRKENPKAASLTELGYLLAVDDFSRIGALRLRDRDGHYLKTTEEGRRATPPLIELQRMFEASRAVERGKETTEDLRYLQGKGTSLGGMRPKCTVIDENGKLAIGKFPSISDARSVTRGEVLALCLARRAGIDAATARIVEIEKTPVALIERFDRDAAFGRIPYLSAASMLQASREDEHSYVEIADAIRSHGDQPSADTRQLWRRIVFNHLITNVDDHLQNHGFLHSGQGHWRLAPAFDINPFPDKDPESKTWLSEQDGPITEIGLLMARCDWFGLTAEQALAALADIYGAVSNWRSIALGRHVGLSQKELDDFAPAFEHAELEAARRLLTA
jgi:serine/threonine-protein kinase HipA